MSLAARARVLTVILTGLSHNNLLEFCTSLSVGSSPAASQVICSKSGPVFERARPVTVPRGVGVGSCGGSRTGSDVGVGVDCWFWPHAGNPRPVARFQGLCACCPRAGSAPEVGEEGRCAVAVSLLPCPVARAVARVSWTPGGELRAWQLAVQLPQNVGRGVQMPFVGAGGKTKSGEAPEYHGSSQGRPGSYPRPRGRGPISRGAGDGSQVWGWPATPSAGKRVWTTVAYNETSHRKVRSTVHSGPPTHTVDTTIFEMWLGNLSTHPGLSIPVAQRVGTQGR